MATVGVGARVDVAGRGVGVDVGGGSVGVDVEGSGVGVDVDGGGEGRGVEGTAVCIRPGSWFCVAQALNTTAAKKPTKRFIVSYPSITGWVVPTWRFQPGLSKPEMDRAMTVLPAPPEKSASSMNTDTNFTLRILNLHFIGNHRTVRRHS